MRGSIPGPWDYNLSERQMLSQLSHPDAPSFLLLYLYPPSAYSAFPHRHSLLSWLSSHPLPEQSGESFRLRYTSSINIPQPETFQGKTALRNVCLLAANSPNEEPGQGEGAEAREGRAFLSGEAQRFPSRVSASLEAAKGANPPLRLRQEARTSVRSSGGAENQGGSGCPPCRGSGSWLEGVCLQPDAAKKDQDEWLASEAVSSFRGCPGAGVLSLSCHHSASRGCSVHPSCPHLLLCYSPWQTRSSTVESSLVPR